VFQRRTGDVRLQRHLASWREVNAPRPPLGHAPHRSVQRGSKARTNARLPHPVCDKFPSAPTNPHNPRGLVQSLLSGMRSTALSHRLRIDPCALRIESSALSRVPGGCPRATNYVSLSGHSEDNKPRERTRLLDQRYSH